MLCRIGGVSLIDIAGGAAQLQARPHLEAALVGAFDAVIAPEHWPSVTEALAEALGGVASCFHRLGAQQSRFDAPMSARYRDLLNDFVAGGWTGQDLRAQRGWPIARTGREVVVEDDVTTPEERARSPIYNELFRPHDLDFIAAAAIRPNGQIWTLNIMRTRKMGPHDAESIAQLHLARPYLSRLLVFAEAMAQAANRGALASLESSGTAAIMLDGVGQVAELNGPAHAVLGEGLAVRNRRLVTQQPKSQAALDALIAASLSPNVSRAGVADAPISIPRPHRAALLVDAIPARDQMIDAFGRRGVILMIRDLDQRPQPLPALLRRLYGMTPREAEVASLIGAGKSVGEVSDLVGLKQSSVRQLIKVVLAKAGVSRQAELVAALSRIPTRT